MSKRTLRDGAAERLEAEVARLTHDLEFVLADYRGFQSVMRGLVERGAVRAEDVRSVEQFLHPILEKEGAATIAGRGERMAVLQRYSVVSIGCEGEEMRAAIIRERYVRRDWPRFWRSRWAYDCCIETFPSMWEASRALDLLPSVLDEIGKEND